MSAASLAMREDDTVGRGHTVRALAAVTALVLLAGGAAWWWHHAHWPVEYVHIDGRVQHADRARMKQVIARHTRAGFFAMDLDALRDDLVALPWVRGASLRRIWPDTLRVTIHEHRPAATWNDGALIGRDGTVFKPDGARPKGLPALSGPKGHGPDMLQRMRKFAARLKPLGLAIAAVRQDARRSWSIDLDDGITVRLGREQVERRLRRFIAVWPSILKSKAARIAAVDLRYTNGFAVAWRDGEAPDSPKGGA